MTRPDVPYRVVINEGIELAKRFGATDGHRYVNAVLDRAHAPIAAPSAARSPESMTAGEFEVIERYFTRRGASRDDVLAGVGDDGALIAAPPGGALVFAVDTIVEGVHFPAGFDARFVGHRALAINLSDLAAMGAEPAWALLALTLPVVDEHWLSGFEAASITLCAAAMRVALVGGDTTRGPLTGLADARGHGAGRPRNPALGRARATTSGSAARPEMPRRDLRSSRTGWRRRAGRARRCSRASSFPQARVALGLALRGVASACIDVSGRPRG